jgi:hypothetical protein
MPRSQICLDENGNTITISQALARRRSKGRFIGSCVKCGGRVRAHSASKNGMAEHFEHIEGNLDCTLSAPHRDRSSAIVG